MARHDGFVRAVCESPHDDTVRLAYADWLDEHDDAPRAEFIRLQCTLAAADPFAPGRRALLRRESELVREHCARWMREDGLSGLIEPEWLGHCPPKGRFRRGFIDRAWFASPEEFWGKAPDLFARAPVTGVSLHAPYTIPPDRQEWFSNTFLAIYYREIGLHQELGLAPPAINGPHWDQFPDPEEFRRMVNAEPFVGLESFEMNTIYTDRRHLEILANSPATPRLRELDLSGKSCLVGDAWGVLLGSPAVAGLRSLRLNDSRLGVAGLRTLVESPHLANFEQLSLEAGPSRAPVVLGPEGVELICAARGLTGLRELCLRGQQGSVAGLHALAAWPGLARLTRLDVSDFYTEEVYDYDDMVPAWAALARSPNWAELRELNLDIDHLPALEAVLDSPNLGTLRVLTFDHRFARYDAGDDVSLQDEAAELLARCPYLADSLELHFPATGLSSAGREVLRDRFADGLVLYEDDRGAHRQPGDWATDQRYRSYFASA